MTSADCFKEKMLACDFTLKLAIVGDATTGKSCLFSRFCNEHNQTFDYSNHTPTICIETASRDFQIDGRRIKANVWDTAGLDLHRAHILSKACYKDAAGILLVYDISKRETFHHLKKWLAEIRVYSPPDVVTMLIGNKFDLPVTQRKVTIDEGFNFARSEGLSAFTETSAVSTSNVDAAFTKLIKDILKRKSNATASNNRLRFSTNFTFTY